MRKVAYLFAAWAVVMLALTVIWWCFQSAPTLFRVLVFANTVIWCAVGVTMLTGRAFPSKARP